MSFNQERPAFPIGINVFVVKNGQVLLGKRKNTYGAGEWGLPGGHLEFGEKMIEAARRELKEETDLECGEFEFINLINQPNSNIHYIQAGFLAKNFSGEVKLTEPDRCEEWQWFDLNNLPENIFSGHKVQVQIFVKNIKFADDLEHN